MLCFVLYNAYAIVYCIWCDEMRFVDMYVCCKFCLCRMCAVETNIVCIAEGVARWRNVFNSMRTYILDWGSLITVLSLSLYVAHSSLSPVAGSSLPPVAGRRYRRLPPFSFRCFYAAGSSVSSVTGRRCRRLRVRRCRRLRVVDITGYRRFRCRRFYAADSSASSVTGRRCRRLLVRRCRRLRVVDIAGYRRFRCRCFYAVSSSVSAVAGRRCRRLRVRRCRRLRVVDIAGYRFCCHCFYVAGQCLRLRFCCCRRLPVSQSPLYVTDLSLPLVSSLSVAGSCTTLYGSFLRNVADFSWFDVVSAN